MLARISGVAQDFVDILQPERTCLQGEDAKLADRGLGVFVEQASSSLNRDASAPSYNIRRRLSVRGANGFHRE